MATCLFSINSGQQQNEMTSESTSRVTINSTTNALFYLSNELSQSVFFNVRLVGVYSSISISLTIYNADTLVVFGTLNITQQNTSTSFNISAGNYIICLRPIFGSYTVDITPTFISYNSTASFNPRSYVGYQSTFSLDLSKPVGVCTRRLLYTMVEGTLPDGLELLDNGLVTGYLPILDCDSYNKNLPTSNYWYHKISDSEYVTPWGRAYRFKVHLTLFDDRTKEDIRWFYISIVNDFTKNIALVDKYEALEDAKIATFEDKIKVDMIDLCKKDASVLPTEISDEEKFYNQIEDKKIDDESPIINDYNVDYSFSDNQEEEYILLNKEMLSDINRLGIIDYYISNYENDSDIIESLKDSIMFNNFLSENNIDSKYINILFVEYEDINVSIKELDGESYLVLINSYNSYNSTVDTSSRQNENYINLYNALPLTTYSLYGWSCSSTLTRG